MFSNNVHGFCLLLHRSMLPIFLFSSLTFHPSATINPAELNRTSRQFMKIDLPPVGRISRSMATTLRRLSMAVLVVGHALSAKPQAAETASATLSAAVAEEPADAAFSYQHSSQAGEHHRRIATWTGTNVVAGAAIKGEFVLLDPGMNYYDEAGVLRSNDPKIEPSPDGAIVTGSSLKVDFSGELDVAGAIDVRLKDGVRLRATPLAIGYFDSGSGLSVTIGTVRAASGKIFSPTKVIYEDAFDGVRADVVYDVTRHSVMQTVIFTENPPPPSFFGLADATSKLEVISEFDDAPAPQKRIKVLKEEKDAVKRAAMHAPDFLDEELKFGDSRIPAGVAFGLNLDSVPGDELRTQPVGKHWQAVPNEGRSVLFESVEYAPIKAQLELLPETKPVDSEPVALKVPSKTRHLPVKRLAAIKRNPMQMAMSGQMPRGFAVDYSIVNGTTYVAALTFNAQTTYLITNAITIGNVTFQAGTVVKYHPIGSLKVTGTVTCNGTYDNPSVLLSYDDHSYGEAIPAINDRPASTGFPNGASGVNGIYLDTPTAATLRFIKIRHKQYGVRIESAPSSGTHTVSDLIIEHCGTGLFLRYHTPTFSNIRLCGNTTSLDVDYTSYPPASAFFTDCEAGYTEIPKSVMSATANTFWPASHPWSGGYDWLPSKAIDNLTGEQYTWHVGPDGQYQTAWLKIDLGSSYPVAKVKYRSRDGASNGTYKQYKIYVTSVNSSNPADWGTPVAQGQWVWSYGAETKALEFSPQSGRYVIFERITGEDGWAAAGEVWIYRPRLLGNEPPTFTSTIANCSLYASPGVAAQSVDIPFTISDLETSADALTLTKWVPPAQQAIIPESNITFGGSGVNRTVRVQTVPGQTGIVPISLYITDQNQGVSSPLTFQVHVIGNPTITPTPGPSTPYSTPQTITITPSVQAQLRTLVHGPNLIDTANWIAGPTPPNLFAPPSGFTPWGASGENFIASRVTPYLRQDLVWVAKNLEDATLPSSDADGGWTGANFSVDTNKLYRFSVWVRKVDGTPTVYPGKTLLGPGVNSVTSLTSTTPEPNPYFTGTITLPPNQWFKLVAYVHPAGASVLSSSGKILYANGTIYTIGLTDFRWYAGMGTPQSTLRAYFRGCNELNVEHEFWNPKVEPISSVNDPHDILFSSGSATPLAHSWDATRPLSVDYQSYVTSTDCSPVVTAKFYTQDTDGDGLPDGWETANQLDANANAADDFDGDGLTNLQEYQKYLAGQTSDPSDNFVVSWSRSGPLSGLERGKQYVTGVEGVTLVLRENGSVYGVGTEAESRILTDLPFTGLATPGSALSVTAGGLQAGAIRANRTIVSWGLVAGFPPVQNDFYDIAVGRHFGIARRQNGNVAPWGTTASIAYTELASNPPTGAIGIAAGWDHAAVLFPSQIVVYGDADGNGGDWNLKAVPAAAQGATAIAAGSYHCLALKNGQVIAWGAGTYGTPDGPTENQGQASVPLAAQSQVIQIAAAGRNSIAKKSDKTVVSWGGAGPAPAGLSSIEHVSASERHVFAEKSGRLRPIIIQDMAGTKCGILGGPTRLGVKWAAPAPSAVNIQFQKRLGSVWQTIGNQATYEMDPTVGDDHGWYRVKLSNGAGEIFSTEQQLGTAPAPTISNRNPLEPGVDLLRGENLALSANAQNQCPHGMKYVWRLNGLPVAALNGNFYYLPDDSGTPVPEDGICRFNISAVTSVHAGEYRLEVLNDNEIVTSTSWTVRVADQGGAIYWGQNTSPWKHLNITNAIALAVGQQHVLALKDDGSIAAGPPGLVGDGQTLVPPGLASGVDGGVAIAAGDAHSLAIDGSGTVRPWGRPAAIASLPATPAGTKPIAVSAGGNQSLVLYANGTVKQFGVTYESNPDTENTISAVASGKTVHLALRANGTIKVWGSSTSPIRQQFPAVLDDVNAAKVVAIAACEDHALALRRDGTILGWGSNADLEANPATPVTDVMAIAVGAHHSMALKRNGTIATWGRNTEGQCNIPQVSGQPLPNIQLIAAGGKLSMASMNSTWVQYPVDPEKDVLVIYRSRKRNPSDAKSESEEIADYYQTYRPQMTKVQRMGIDIPYFTNPHPEYPEDIERFADIAGYNAFTSAVMAWFNDPENKTKRPRYLILMFGVPTQVCTLTPDFNNPGQSFCADIGDNSTWGGVDYNFRESVAAAFGGWKPIVTRINGKTLADCKAYIDKIKTMAARALPNGSIPNAGKVIIRASATDAAGNNRYYLDDAQNRNYAYRPGADIRNALLEPGVLGAGSSDITYSAGPDNSVADHIGTFTSTIHSLPNSVAGYWSWGGHSSLTGNYPLATPANEPYRVRFAPGNGWYIIQTSESYNGFRNLAYGFQASFTYWFAATAFGGSGYNNTPIGAFVNAKEPGRYGNYPSIAFSLWARGKAFGTCVANSYANSTAIGVGDPLVAR